VMSGTWSIGHQSLVAEVYVLVVWSSGVFDILVLFLGIRNTMIPWYSSLYLEISTLALNKRL
jgi:hypothetical protein